MRLTHALTVLALGTAVSGLTVPAPPAHAAAPVRIMPLGASITWGTGSGDGNGYREELRKHLALDAGVAIDFVGSVQSGTAADRDNEGHPGYRIDQIASGVDGWIAANRPDVVLLNVGTNDTLQNYQLPTAPARLNALLNRIVADAPLATVVFSTLVPSTDAANNSEVQAFNAQLPAIAQAQAAAGHRVRLVDFYAGLTPADIGSDGIHPTNGGYVKLANLWHSGLQPVLGAGTAWPLYKQDFGDNWPLTWVNTVQGSVGVGGYCCGLPGMESARRAETAHGGTYALMYSGNDLSATGSYSYNRVFDVHLPLTAKSVLTYWIYPQTTNARFVALDLALTDGRSLRDSGAVDQWGVRAHPQFQGQGGRLVANQWNLVQVGLGSLAGGTVDQIRIGYDQPAGTGLFRGYVDDILIANNP
ncbi:lysophospholipase L1-like esterase [Allocatelliglobosispora scoriae]|uniref:Lysophospholipase L1-like esterase n=1 Tax=Allocatelliglobosispora scoriae TaxID=643052 RepID=A0A841C1F7_9ACTN|nr:SGNH/GDSL hydrolase family protein [Allocatelliglobosispora scoriae]MBB5873578.1 lysophospholipase L1-like esterase [Allocatelliglobosispora scoriae]